MNSKVNTMQQERDPLNLSRLPRLTPPRDDWPAIKSVLKAKQNKRRLWKTAGAALAAAASVTLVFSLVLNQPADPAVNEPTLAQPDSAQKSGQTKAELVASLISLSQRLETSLRHIRSEVAVMPTGPLIYQVELEDLVAQVDEELNMNPDSTALWSQRVNLLLDLTQLYKNELRRKTQRMASL